MDKATRMYMIINEMYTDAWEDFKLAETEYHNSWMMSEAMERMDILKTVLKKMKEVMEEDS